MDPDFDSEEEYNSEVDSQEQFADSSDVEYDDGKMSEGDRAEDDDKDAGSSQGDSDAEGDENSDNDD